MIPGELIVAELHLVEVGPLGDTPDGGMKADVKRTQQRVHRLELDVFALEELEDEPKPARGE